MSEPSERSVEGQSDFDIHRATEVASPRTDAHPADLLEIDGRYIVPWGRREIAIVCSAAAVAAAVAVALAAALSPWWALLLLPVATLAGFLVLFFRNPSRTTPSEPGLLVAPADGTVWDVMRVDEPEFMGGSSIRIGIFLSIFDVHINRAPAAGRVEWVEHRPGRHHDARSKEAELENESCWIGMVRDDEGGPSSARVLVKQISGAVARRIVCPLRPSTAVARGGLIGMIKYGSRTELYIPADPPVELRVAVGDKVKGGRTVLAAWSG